MSLADEVKTESAGSPPAIAEGEASPEAPVGEIQAGSQKTDWFYDENIPGNGEKPEWLKADKYKTAVDQAKAYTEMEKRFGAFKGAPDKYDLTLDAETGVAFSDDDPLIQDFLDYSKKNNVSQEFMSYALTAYANAITSHIPDAEAEMAKLGPNAKEDVSIVTNYYAANLDEKDMGIFKSMLTTADSVRLFDKIRMMSTNSDVAPPNSTATTRETPDQVLASVNNPLYHENSAAGEQFRKDVRKRLATAQGIK